jgi:hypothetical protein
MRYLVRALRRGFVVFGPLFALSGLVLVTQSAQAGASTTTAIPTSATTTALSMSGTPVSVPTAWPTSAALPQTQSLGTKSAPLQLVHTNGPHSTGATQTWDSSNWAGLVDTDTTFTGVQGDWTVPTVQPSQSEELSSSWIGIDGATNSNLIQTGTTQESYDGSTSYYAWYEILPAASIPIGLVSPGDHMHASITEDAGSPGTWNLIITDLTSGDTASGQLAYDGPADSAEWIEEAPSLNGQEATLANFGSATFTNISSSEVDPGAVTRSPIDMVGANGVMASPSTIGANSFTVTYTGPTSPSPTTTSTPDPSPAPTTSTTGNSGYWLVGSDGGIFSFGSAGFYGSTGAVKLQRPVVGITPTQDNKGYWLVASDGGIFSFGDAGYYGSIPGAGLAPAGSSNPKRLNAPIVGMVPSADGGGYFMVASDGGVFTFGDAKFAGSCPGIGGCSGAAVSVVPDASGNGYWLVTATGHVYAFGDATNYGAPGPQSVAVTSAVRTADGKGYWILFANGVVSTFGDATNLGGPPPSINASNPATAILSTGDGKGYWVASSNGSVFSYGDAPYEGGMNESHLNGSIIAAAGW